jgi:hypothetical protein
MSHENPAMTDTRTLIERQKEGAVLAADLDFFAASFERMAGPTPHDGGTAKLLRKSAAFLRDLLAALPQAQEANSETSIVHLCDDGGQGDIHIKCSGAWTEPKWKQKDDPDGYETGVTDVWRAQTGDLYTFEESLVTCGDCKGAGEAAAPPAPDAHAESGGLCPKCGHHHYEAYCAPPAPDARLTALGVRCAECALAGSRCRQCARIDELEASLPPAYDDARLRGLIEKWRARAAVSLSAGIEDCANELEASLRAHEGEK